MKDSQIYHGFYTIPQEHHFLTGILLPTVNPISMFKQETMRVQWESRPVWPANTNHNKVVAMPYNNVNVSAHFFLSRLEFPSIQALQKHALDARAIYLWLQQRMSEWDESVHEPQPPMRRLHYHAGAESHTAHTAARLSKNSQSIGNTHCVFFQNKIQCISGNFHF